MRRVMLALCAAGLVAGCGVAPAGTAIDGTGIEASDVLFLSSGAGIAITPAAGGSATVIEEGVVSPDGEVIGSAVFDGSETLVRRLEQGGEEISSITVPGELQARVLSGSGELLALTEPRAVGNAPYLPEPKKETRLVVAGPDGHDEYVLDGNFEPEAFATSDRELFMIEYIPALAPERYRVRRLRLKSGEVLPIGRLKGFAPEQMQGTGRTQIYAPYGDELYTLYTQQAEAGHAVSDHDDSAHAFVHLLNLDGSWAHCIDLPHEFASGQATASALAINDYGTRLFVADWTNGMVAAVNPERVKVVDTRPIDFGPPDEETFAAATNELLYVAGHDEIVVIDGGSLEVVDRWQLGEEISGLGLGADEEILYVSLPDRIVAVDVTTGTGTGSIPTVGNPRIETIES